MTETIEPGDIHPSSGARVPLPKRDELPPEAQNMYDHYVDPQSDTYVGLHGPGCVKLHSPRLAALQQPSNRYIRHEAEITSYERELAVLATARELDSQFEWMAHEEPGRNAGISEKTIEAIRTRGPLDGLPEMDAIVIRLAREALGDHRVGKQTYADALKLFGLRKLIDIVALMGNYSATAMLLAVFDVQLHPGKSPRLPPRQYKRRHCTMVKWLRFTRDGRPGFGTVDGDTIAVHDGDMFADARPTGESVTIAEVTVTAPVRPSKILALWNNSRSGAEKQKLDPPERPLYFVKTPNTHLDPEGAIPKPASYDGRVIFEAELGIVIAKRCRDVSAEDAAGVVFGYTCVNDVTALQLIREDPTFPQWSRAKNFDGFTPMGPVIETELAGEALAGAAIRAELNGRERQNYAVSDLFFQPLELVSLLSRDLTLEPGDLISCGTGPGAVPMKPGDRIEISIDGIGTLRNPYGS